MNKTSFSFDRAPVVPTGGKEECPNFLREGCSESSRRVPFGYPSKEAERISY